jgi:secreted protein with Ig-like and vWFA domain
MWNIHSPEALFFIKMTAALGINDRVTETLGITVELKITSQVANFKPSNSE